MNEKRSHRKTLTLFAAAGLALVATTLSGYALSGDDDDTRAGSDRTASKPEEKQSATKTRFREIDTSNDKSISESEAKAAGLTKLVGQWDAADSNEDGVLSKSEFASYKQEHASIDNKPGPGKKFNKVDKDGDGALTKDEVRFAGMAKLVQAWDKADGDDDSTLSQVEFISYVKKHHGASTKPQKTFLQVDANNDKKISKAEAENAGMNKLVKKWLSADSTGNGTLSEKEYAAFLKKPGEPKAASMTIGAGKFRSPETVLWDDQADVYLVSNINGKLTAMDDNGFISRIAPDGTVLNLKWIDGAKPQVALHGPKGMIFHKNYLIVADAGAVHFFDRATGKPLDSIIIKDTYMLNDLAVGPDGAIYVSDVGSKVAKNPGAVYRLGVKNQPELIAEGIDYDRPDGLIAHGKGLLVAPFEAHAKELYELSLDGSRSTYATLPKPKLDGLLRLPDGSLVVTSWKGKAVYHLVDGKATAIAKGIPSPAQIDYDRKRGRLLVPVLRQNKLLVYPLSVGE